MSLSTAGDVITKALQMIGSYDAQSPLQSADAQLGLDLLNGMMESWSNLTLACYEVTEQSAPLVPGQGVYTIGPGGAFNMTRPLKILTDPGTAYVQDTNGNNYPMQVVPRDKWNLYSNRSGQITSNFPNVLFYDPQFPLGVINITPFPTIAYTMFWDSMLQFSDFSSLTTQVNLPPGYMEAMYSNLALRLHPFFQDAQLNPMIVRIAAESLGNIKRTNQREIYALYDPEIVSSSQLQYNVYTDTPGSVVQS